MVNGRTGRQFYQAWSTVRESVFIAINSTDGVFAVKKLLRKTSLENGSLHIGYLKSSHDASVAWVNHVDLEDELFRHSSERALCVIIWRSNLSTHRDIVDSCKGKIFRLRHHEVSLESLMVEKRHHARHNVFLVVVALRNLRKRVLQTRYWAGANRVLDFIDWSCNQLCNYARQHVEIKVERIRNNSGCRLCVVSPHNYLGIHLNRVHANQRQVVSLWDLDLLVAWIVCKETLLAN